MSVCVYLTLDVSIIDNFGFCVSTCGHSLHLLTVDKLTSGSRQPVCIWHIRQTADVQKTVFA